MTTFLTHCSNDSNISCVLGMYICMHVCTTVYAFVCVCSNIFIVQLCEWPRFDYYLHVLINKCFVVFRGLPKKKRKVRKGKQTIVTSLIPKGNSCASFCLFETQKAKIHIQTNKCICFFYAYTRTHFCFSRNVCILYIFYLILCAYRLWKKCCRHAQQQLAAARRSRESRKSNICSSTSVGIVCHWGIFITITI